MTDGRVDTLRDFIEASAVYGEPTGHDDWDDRMAVIIERAGLTPNELRALQQYYGNEPRTLEQIAGEMGISHTMVGRHRDRAIAKLEHILGRKIVLKG